MSITKEYMEKLMKDTLKCHQEQMAAFSEVRAILVDIQNKFDDRQAQALQIESKKTGVKRMDIIAFVKDEYCKDKAIFDEFLGDKKDEAFEDAKTNAIGANSKKLSETEIDKKIAIYIWRNYIKEIPEGETHFRNLKNEKCGNSIVDIPERSSKKIKKSTKSAVAESDHKEAQIPIGHDEVDEVDEDDF